MRIALVWLVLSLMAHPAAAETAVNFLSLDGTTPLVAHLNRPEGDAPQPAVVLMHGCSGLNDAKATGNGPIPVIGTDREARSDAFARVLAYLKQHLESN